MKTLTILCILGLTVLVVANTETFAAPQEKGTKKCNDKIDNDGDGLVDGDDSDCGGGNTDDFGRRVRVVFGTSGAIRADVKATCDNKLPPDFIGYDYWNTGTGGGGDDIQCEKPPSQRTSSAILACGWCFNTFGPRRPHDPSSSNGTQRWVTFDWNSSGAGATDIDDEIYDTDTDSACIDLDGNYFHTPACNTPLITAGLVDNLEISFDMPNPFVEPAPTISNFEIEIVAPRVRNNGRVAWQTKYTLVYLANLSIISPDDSNPNLLTISTMGGAATLTRLSDGMTVAVTMPFSLDARQVYYSVEEGDCCYGSQDPPPP